MKNDVSVKRACMFLVTRGLSLNMYVNVLHGQVRGQEGEGFPGSSNVFRLRTALHPQWGYVGVKETDYNLGVPWGLPPFFSVISVSFLSLLKGQLD